MLAALLGAGGAGCSSPQTPDEGDRLSRHFELATWGDGLAAQLDDPARWGTEAALLVATPILHHYDREIEEHLSTHTPVTGGDPARGQAAAVALGIVAVGLGAQQWIEGDHGEAIEVAAESILLTEGTTEILKKTVNRPRPEGGSTESFPSSHASFSFAAATLIARETELMGSESENAWWSELGWLAYLPATYVAINRVEAARHWPSDVAAGAFLGVFFTNWVFDAHYGASGSHGEPVRHGIYDPERRAPPKTSSLMSGWMFRPLIGDQQVGLLVAHPF